MALSGHFAWLTSNNLSLYGWYGSRNSNQGVGCDWDVTADNREKARIQEFSSEGGGGGGTFQKIDKQNKKKTQRRWGGGFSIYSA